VDAALVAATRPAHVPQSAPQCIPLPPSSLAPPKPAPALFSSSSDPAGGARGQGHRSGNGTATPRRGGHLAAPSSLAYAHPCPPSGPLPQLICHSPLQAARGHPALRLATGDAVQRPCCRAARAGPGSTRLMPLSCCARRPCAADPQECCRSCPLTHSPKHLLQAYLYAHVHIGRWGGPLALLRPPCCNMKPPSTRTHESLIM
jgi:hypothetical protein